MHVAQRQRYIRQELDKVAEGLSDAHIGLFRAIKQAEGEGRGEDWKHELRAADVVVMELRNRIQEVYDQLS